MRVSVEIPDELVAALVVPGQDAARAALEAWGLEAYRERRLSAFQLRTLLGIPSRWDLDAFLKEHEVYDYAMEEFEKDLATIHASAKSGKPTARHDCRGRCQSSPLFGADSSHRRAAAAIPPGGCPANGCRGVTEQKYARSGARLDGSAAVLVRNS